MQGGYDLGDQRREQSGHERAHGAGDARCLGRECGGGLVVLVVGQRRLQVRGRVRVWVRVSWAGSV